MPDSKVPKKESKKLRARGEKERVEYLKKEADARADIYRRAHESVYGKKKDLGSIHQLTRERYMEQKAQRKENKGLQPGGVTGDGNGGKGW